MSRRYLSPCQYWNVQDPIIFRYDENFQLLNGSRYEQGQPPHANNDIPAICGTEFQGWHQSNKGYEISLSMWMKMPHRWNLLTRKLTSNDRSGMTELMVNSSLLGWSGRDLSISVYDTDLQLIEQASIPPFGDTILHYWVNKANR